MSKAAPTNIARLVDHHGGPGEVSKKLRGTPARQEIERWVNRGWCSPMYLFRLKPLLLRGMRLDDLNADRGRATGRDVD